LRKQKLFRLSSLVGKVFEKKVIAMFGWPAVGLQRRQQRPIAGYYNAIRNRDLGLDEVPIICFDFGFQLRR